MKRRRFAGVTCDADYQIRLEDALACAGHDIVIFVDAARGRRRPFVFRKIEPDPALPAMSHTLGPAAVLALAAELYGRAPAAYILAIRGHRWTLGEGLSDKAEGNLVLALEFVKRFLKEARP